MHVPVCQRIDPSPSPSSLRRAGDDEGLRAEAGRAAEIAVDGVGGAMRAGAENVALQTWKQNTTGSKAIQMQKVCSARNNSEYRPLVGLPCLHLRVSFILGQLLDGAGGFPLTVESAHDHQGPV